MRIVVMLLAVIAACLSIWSLEAGRNGLTIGPFPIADGPPATLYEPQGQAAAPVVVIAHGFAGSRQLMEAYALTLSRAGYLVVSYDLTGHGRNPRPMTGDVTSIDGTTRLLVEEVRQVAKAALRHPRADGRLAYLGHSMASDIIIRAAADEPKPDAIVAISAFSLAVTEDFPANLLLVTGAWEDGLADAAQAMLRLADPTAALGQTVGDPAMGNGRRAVLAPGVEHVGVLYSAPAQQEAVEWLNATFGLQEKAEPAPRGLWIMLLLVAMAALAWPMARLLPKGPAQSRVGLRPFLWATGFPLLVVPLALAPLRTQVLPVLVADYLVLHFAAYGMLGLLALWRNGLLRGQFPPRVWPLAAAVAVFAIAVIGGMLDRYVASFLPNAGRLVIIAGLALGTVPYLVSDAILTEGGRAPLWRVLAARGGFLVSLMGAVALNFDRLMFLLIILPIILLFFVIFGTMAGWIGRRTGLPAIAGIGFGLLLAWALGVTFPLFA
ncbi:alpha/beta hydrolase [Fuscovulum ytuae]|uniref:Alpha/beta fold hydrolase n=1 Tax=Fuscovulum ytuae TaxID=3042299 RepID=A0ABY8Q870_9RHOB|nr:alpha/beta fold hydrolase [Fuscovulum sp. YMD61]WGV17054.1 alpha/beta fold hydrolase [Fuscovulum sp. YMD61]